MAEEDHNAPFVQRLSDRRTGVEHPCWELTRQAAFDKSAPKAKADFLKLVHGICNAHTEEERYLVIGADQKNKEFVSVTNWDLFDPGAVMPFLGKHLSPTPDVEIFHTLRTDDDLPFVLLVFSNRQPRPVVAISDVQDEKGNKLFWCGQIWVKEGTALHIATAVDIERMIQKRVETEADHRARKQFSDMKDQLIAIQQFSSANGRKTPTEDLIYGLDEKFSFYVTDLFANDDMARFKMLIEIFRDCLIEKRHVYQSDGGPNVRDFEKDLLDAKRVKFFPAFRRLVELGLMAVKHQISEEWFGEIANLFVEIFDASSDFVGLRISDHVDSRPFDIDKYVGSAMLGIEVAIGVRIVGTYALKRNRKEYLSPLLKSTVGIVGANNRQKTPLMFWPFRQIEVAAGLISLCWEKRVSNAFGNFFSNQQEFIRAACQLEFILELNSYVCIGNAGSRAAEWIGQFKPELAMSYWPDLFRYDLSFCRPIAIEVRAALESGPDDWLLVYLTVEKMPFDVILKTASRERRLLLLGGFLRYLSKQRGKMFPDRYYRNVDTWGAELNQLIAAWSEDEAKKTVGET